MEEEIHDGELLTTRTPLLPLSLPIVIHPFPPQVAPTQARAQHVREDRRGGNPIEIAVVPNREHGGG